MRRTELYQTNMLRDLKLSPTISNTWYPRKLLTKPHGHATNPHHPWPSSPSRKSGLLPSTANMSTGISEALDQLHQGFGHDANDQPVRVVIVREILDLAQQGLATAKQRVAAVELEASQLKKDRREYREHVNLKSANIAGQIEEEKRQIEHTRAAVNKALDISKARVKSLEEDNQTSENTRAELEEALRAQQETVKILTTNNANLQQQLDSRNKKIALKDQNIAGLDVARHVLKDQISITAQNIADRDNNVSKLQADLTERLGTVVLRSPSTACKRKTLADDAARPVEEMVDCFRRDKKCIMAILNVVDFVPDMQLDGILDPIDVIRDVHNSLWGPVLPQKLQGMFQGIEATSKNWYCMSSFLEASTVQRDGDIDDFITYTGRRCMTEAHGEHDCLAVRIVKEDEGYSKQTILYCLKSKLEWLSWASQSFVRRASQGTSVWSSRDISTIGNGMGSISLAFDELRASQNASNESQTLHPLTFPTSVPLCLCASGAAVRGYGGCGCCGCCSGLAGTAPICSCKFDLPVHGTLHITCTFHPFFRLYPLRPLRPLYKILT